MVGVLRDSATTGFSLNRFAGRDTPLFSQQATGSDIQASNSISLDHSVDNKLTLHLYF